jgi:hypothetical protein
MPRIMTVCFLAVSFSTSINAVDMTKVLANAKETTAIKPVQHEKVAPYWTMEPGWHTNLQLRNNLLTSDLTVATFLRLSNGSEVRLSTVTIPAGTVTTVDLMQELNKVAPRLVHRPGSFGSVSFQYSSMSAGNLYAVAMVHMDGQPIGYHMDAATSGKRSIAGSREGIWWLPQPGVRDYLVISNGSSRGTTGVLSLYDSSGKETRSTIKLGSHQTVRVVVSQLVNSAKLAGNYGGIKFAVPNSARDVDSVHFLYDPTVGFSALMKMFHFDGTAKVEQRTWAGNTQWTMWAPMLALKNPDPMVGFPQGTTLQPTVFLHNTTAQKVDANITIGWRGPATQGKANLAPVTLKPFETVKLDIGPMQQQFGIPEDAHWGLVTVTTPADPDDLVAVASSYDSTGRYGAQTPFSDQLADHWAGGLWQVDSTHNSIIAVTNGGTQSTDALLTFIYNRGKDKYQIQKTIPPGDQLWLNLADLIHNSVPDKDGKVFPTSLTSGTYELRDLKPAKSLAGSLFEGKIIVDKTWGHLTYGCMECCGYTPAGMSPSPLGLPVGTGDFQQMMVTDNCFGGTFAYDYATSWWTDDTSIASVDQSGYVTANSAGSTVNRGSGLLESGDGEDIVPPQQCPEQNANANAPVNATPVISSVDPVQGLIGVNTVVNINGTGLQNTTSVDMGDANMSISVIANTPTLVKANVTPSLSARSGSHNVTVTAGGQQSNNDKTFTVQVPHHLQVVDDETGGLPGCPTVVGRQLTLQVVEQNGTPINGQPAVQENFLSISPNSCGNGQPIPSACSASEAGATFVDTISVNTCAAAGTSCGYNITDEWQWCPSGTAPTNAGKLTDTVHANQVTVNGVASPDPAGSANVKKIPAGTPIFP